MSDSTPALAGGQPRWPFYRRWLLWLAGSLLVAAAPVLLRAWLQLPDDPTPATGVLLRAFGVFVASNTVIIEDGAALPEGEPVLMESRGGTASNVLHVKKKP